MRTKFVYQTCCVDSTAEDIDAMVDDATEVTLQTIRRHCDIAAWEMQMGYARGSERGLHLAGDPYVSFHKSRFRGRPCFYIDHSRIEYVFAPNDGIEAPHERQTFQKPELRSDRRPGQTNRWR